MVPGTARVVAASDVGGTFTDLLVWDGRRLHALKRATEAKARERVVVEGTRELLGTAGRSPRDLVRVVHGTTAATNAVLQRKGGRVALVTNRGFEDAIEIGRQNRPRLYDLKAVRPEPLVPRALRFGVLGRLDKDGDALRGLDAAGVRDVAQRILRSEVDAVAVCFLHSYADARHEVEAARILLRAGVARVSTSAEVSPEFREYERMSTTVVNAFLQPVFEWSLERLEVALAAAGSTAPLFVVESSGGMMSVREAQRLPVRTVLSGPAGGVAAAAELTRRLRIRRALTLDMGGTSTDLAVLENGRPATRIEGDVAGIPLRVPMLDLETIGSGGGSIARVDPGGLLRVGPESAEAWPGPACYGRGGREATLTDADVVLGRVAPEHFLGGKGPITLDAGRARSALVRLGRSMSLDGEAAARAVVELATTNLHRGIRLVTTERGDDPADFALVVFGGAGPLHGIEAAQGLGIQRVVVPAQPAVFSAWGMLVGEVHHASSESRLVRSDEEGFPAASKAFSGLESKALARMREEGFAKRAVRIQRSVDLRYLGQSYELNVRVRSAKAAGLRAAVSAFHLLHRRRFGHADRSAVVQLVALRVDARAAPSPLIRAAKIETGSSRPRASARLGERVATFHGHGVLSVAVWSREGLRAGNRLRGPAIVEGGDHTFLVPPGAQMAVGPWGDAEVALS